MTWALAAAALVGLAFNVKLAQALVPLPAFVVIWVAAVPRRRARVLAATAATFVIVAMSWIVIASLTPTADRPHPVGSVTGSIYRVVFVFNGIDRISAKGVPLGPTDPTHPGLLRLVQSPGDYAQLIGVALVAALALLLAVVALLATDAANATSAITRRDRAAARPRDAASRVARWTAVGLGTWLAVAVVLFSVIRHLQTRYLETASAPLAAILGITAAALLRRSAQPSRRAWPAQLPTRGTVATLATLALFAFPLRVSVGLIDHGVTDAARGNAGAQFSSFLRVHSRDARYETASDDTLGVVGLVSADDRPVLILNDLEGPLVRLAALERLVRRGAVRYVLLEHPCTTGRGCPATTRWSLRHAVRVHGYLFRYDA